MEESKKLATIAIVVSIIAGLIGVFGGVPGIKQVFFSKPAISFSGFLPVIVFDEGSSLDTKYPKFSLNGFLKVNNPNSFDISVTEIRIYGRTIDSSGKYKFPGNKPLIYELNLLGSAEEGEGIVKGYGTSFIRFKIVQLDNKQGPGEMLTPMKSGRDPEIGQIVFTIFYPSFNQLFKWNERRVPRQFVEQVKTGELTFSVGFNSELISIAPKNIFQLHHCSESDWEQNKGLIQVFNTRANM